MNISGVTVREGSTFGIFADLSTVNLSDVKATASGNGIQLTRSTGSLANVTASGNSGAGINLARSSDFTVTKSTVNGNGSDGVLHDRTFDSSFTNVTISGNGGYGFENLAGTGDLTNLTIHGNAVGLYVIVTSPTLKNTIVAGSTGAANCQFDIGGSITSAGQNLASDDTCGLDGPGDQPNTDPLLGPLADNGGPTATHALLAGSPAIDAGSADCPPPATDQRGITRPLDGDGNGSAICDIGAFEVAPKFGVADDFSATANPSGCWSYGFRPLGGSFILYDQYGQFHVAGLDEWRLQSSENPIVAHNSSANAVTFSTLTVGAGQVIFHPGAQGQQSVIRFTAPFAGDFMIDRRDFQRCRQRWRRHRRARYQERDGFIRRQLERPGQRW